MEQIRPAAAQDLARIAEIEIFNYRLSFYPIFQNDGFYFHELQVPRVMARRRAALETVFVFDDGVVKGFVQVEGREVKKLFVEPVLQGRSIGGRLLDFAVTAQGARDLWALEKNTRAIAFYQRHGFSLTGERRLEEGTAEHLVRMERAGP